jgi:hypothetical protein
MSDSIENQINQINQFALEQKSSPPILNPRNKKNKNKILAAIALIMLLAVGAVSSFILLGQKQDTRNQASVANGLVNIKLQRNVDCAIGQTCYVDVLVNTGSSNIDALQAKIVFDQNSINSVDGVIFKPSENLSFQKLMPGEQPILEVSVQSGNNASGTAEKVAVQGDAAMKPEQGITFEENSKMMAKPMLSLAKNEVSPSKEILLAWTLSNSSIPFNSNNSDYLLGKIEFVAKQTFKSGDSTNNMVMSLDQSFSKATLYKTGQDSLNTPSPLTIALNMEVPVERIPCKGDSSCPTGQYCYSEPAPICADGKVCPTYKAVSAYCKEKITKPGTCQTDTDCAKNEYCYQPPMPTCPQGVMCSMVVPVKSCKEKPVAVTPTATLTPVVSVTPGRISCKGDASCPTGQYCYQEEFPAESGQTRELRINSYCKNLETKPGTCQIDTDCAKGQTCYQPPMPTCPEGAMCKMVVPAKYCKETIVIVTKTPTPTPTPVVSVSVKPSNTPTPISCAVPSCKNGVLRLMEPQYVNRGPISGQSCPIYVCEQIVSCQYDYSIWSECNYGVQSRAISSSSKVGCSAPMLKQACDRPCSSDSNCSAGETCIMKQAPQVSGAEKIRISNMGYCSAATNTSYDLNKDGAVNVLDLSVVIKNLFTSNAVADVNKDKTVDIADYSLVLKNLINKEFMAY